MFVKSEKPFAGYVRVSRQGERDDDRLRSPELQEEKIRSCAEAEELTVTMYPAEIDVSGSKAKRPVLDSIITAVQAGELGGIIVAKLDRLSRLTPKDRIDLFDAVESAGGVILSGSEQLDSTTSEGRFARDVFLGIARMQWEKYAEEFRRAKEGAIKRGAKIGPAPYGYVSGEKGVLKVDPVAGPIVTETFKRAAKGGIGSALAYLTEKAPDARYWSTTRVRALLSNRTYLGEAIYRRGVRDDDGNVVGYEDDLLKREAHKPLTKRVIFEAAKPSAPDPRKRAADYPLSGIATCASCGTHMVGARGGHGIRTYRCAASLNTYRGEKCPATVTVKADTLEEYVTSIVRAAIEGVRIEVTSGHAEDLERLERELLDAEGEMTAFNSDAEGGAMLRRVGQYGVALNARVEAVEAAQRAYQAAASAAAAESFSYPVGEAWSKLSGQELAEVFRRALAVVEVSKARGRGRNVGPIEDRVRLLPQDADMGAGVLAANGSDDHR